MDPAPWTPAQPARSPAATAATVTARSPAATRSPVTARDGRPAGPGPSQADLDRMQSYGLVSPAQLAELQRRANADSSAALRRSRVEAVSLDVAVRDAHDALAGIAADLLGAGPRTSAWDIFTHGDRLRGLGVLLMTMAMAALVVDYIMAR